MGVTVNGRERLYRGRVFEMFRENVTLENGVVADLDLIRHPGAAAMLPMPDPETAILVRQYRHAVGGYIWEIPAGTLEPGEDPLTGARRELAEETGFAAEQWESLGEIVPVPGYADECIHLFLAEALTPVRQSLDADEVLAVHALPLARVLEMADGGEIRDAKTLCALFRFIRRRGRG